MECWNLSSRSFLTCRIFLLTRYSKTKAVQRFFGHCALAVWPLQSPLHTASNTPDQTNRQMFHNQTKNKSEVFWTVCAAAWPLPAGTEEEQIGTATHSCHCKIGICCQFLAFLENMNRNKSGTFCTLCAGGVAAASRHWRGADWDRYSCHCTQPLSHQLRRLTPVQSELSL